VGAARRTDQWLSLSLTMKESVDDGAHAGRLFELQLVKQAVSGEMAVLGVG